MKIYRSREGKILGVCQGISDYTGFEVKYIRIAAVIAAVFTVGWVVAAYLLAALLIPVKRPEGYESKGFKENFEDFREDAEDFVKKEYNDLKEAGSSMSDTLKERKASKKTSEKVSPNETDSKTEPKKV